MYLLVNGMTWRTCSLIMFTLAHFCYKPPQEKPLTMEMEVEADTISKTVDALPEKTPIPGYLPYKESTHL